MPSRATLLEGRLFQILIATASSGLFGMAWMVVTHPLVIVVLGVLPIAAVIAFSNPFLLCLAFIIFSFFRIHEAFPFLMPLKLPSLLALGSFAVVGWHIATRQLTLYWQRELTAFSIFFVLVFLGLFLAANKGVAIAYFTGIYMKIGIMVLIIAWLTRSSADFHLAMRLIVISGVVIALVALSNKANGIGLVEGTRVTIGRNIGSMLGDPNDLALVLTFPLSFALGLLTTKGLPRLDRVLGLAGYVLVVMGIIATQSRGGLLGIIAVTGTFGWRLVQNKVLLIGAGGFALLVLVAAAGISDRSSGGAAEEGIDESAMGRIHAWSAAIGMAAARPLNGVGLNNFYSNYYFYTPHWDGKNHAVHSTWFGVLAETGYPGLIAFIAMVTVAVLSVLASLRLLSPEARGPTYDPRAYAMGASLIAGLAGFCVSGSFLTMGFVWPVYILIALTTALGRLASQSS